MANYEPIHYFPVRYVLFSALGAIHAENPYLVYLLCQKMGSYIAQKAVQITTMLNSQYRLVEIVT